MKYLLTILLALPLLGCISTSEGPKLDVKTIHQEVFMAKDLLYATAEMISVDDPETGVQITELALMLNDLEAELKIFIDQGGDQADAIQAIDLFLDASKRFATENISDPDKSAKVRFALELATYTLNRAKLYLQ